MSKAIIHHTSLMVFFMLMIYPTVYAQIRIQPFPENSFYWEYKNKPVLLVGASNDDNLFQYPNLKAHLDNMKTVGANYIRNTMSERKIHGGEASAFVQENGTYDLTKWNPEYWQRFDSLLKWTFDSDIIVQVELWATHDVFKQENWNVSPWNPDRNVNYTWKDTRLSPQVAEHANQFHAFFNSVPEALNDTVLLKYQKQFVENVLARSLAYPHVLYCITNEIQHAQSKHWSWYWAEFVKEIAEQKGVEVQVTEMYWAPDLKDDQHKLALDYPEVYTFFESSQNSVIRGQENWDNLQYVRHYLSENPIPINSVKIYGKTGEVAWTGSDEEAVDRVWRNMLGGCASSRFHRNEKGKYGLGLNELSANSLKSVQLFLEDVKPWRAKPANTLLINRTENEAYAMADKGDVYAVYFPGNGNVSLKVNGTHEYELRWINVREGREYQSETITGTNQITLSTPEKEGKWLVTLVRK